MASPGKGKQTENTLQQQAGVSAQAAATIDPLAQKQRDYWGKIFDWATGAGGKPVDVRALPDGAPVALYNAAKTSHDAGRVGKGLMLGDNSNPALSEALDKETQLERDQAASGALENEVDSLTSSANSNLTGLSDRATAQREQAAALDEQRYRDYLNRPQRPSLLKQLALGGLSAAGAYFTGGASLAGKGGAGMGSAGKI